MQQEIKFKFKVGDHVIHDEYSYEKDYGICIVTQRTFSYVEFEFDNAIINEIDHEYCLYSPSKSADCVLEKIMEEEIRLVDASDQLHFLSPSR